MVFQVRTVNDHCITTVRIEKVKGQGHVRHRSRPS